MHFRFTNKELEEFSDNKMINYLIAERMSGQGLNIYSPLYQRLSRLEKKYDNLVQQEQLKAQE